MDIESSDIGEFELIRELLISAIYDIDYVPAKEAELEAEGCTETFLYNMELCRYALAQVVAKMPASIALADFSLSDLFADEEFETILDRYSEECDALAYDLAYEIAFCVFVLLNKKIIKHEDKENKEEEEETEAFKTLLRMIDES